MLHLVRLQWPALSKGTRQYRSRIEITANILEIAKQGSRKTRIMYLGNLSFDLIQKYLKQLEELDLLQIKQTTDGARIYHVTPKGQAFLADFQDFQKHTVIADNKKANLEKALAQK